MRAPATTVRTAATMFQRGGSWRRSLRFMYSGDCRFSVRRRSLTTSTISDAATATEAPTTRMKRRMRSGRARERAFVEVSEVMDGMVGEGEEEV